VGTHLQHDRRKLLIRKWPKENGHLATRTEDFCSQNLSTTSIYRFSKQKGVVRLVCFQCIFLVPVLLENAWHMQLAGILNISQTINQFEINDPSNFLSCEHPQKNSHIIAQKLSF